MRRVRPKYAAALRSMPPSTNRGVTERAPLARLEQREIVVTDTGEIKVVEVRVPTNGQVAMIDTLRFTIHESTWNGTACEQLVGDEEFVREASRHLEQIFGFGVTADMRKGRDFYLNAWELGDGYGYVAFGGERQKETMLVNLTGQGCMAAKPGWEGRLYDFLTCVAKRPTITRVDLAHDCINGEFTVDDADRWFDDGLFTSSVVDPSHEQRGNWRKPNGRGRSLYIGSRRNGKLCRVYEKGREQGDADSEWVRFEVEVRNQKRVIPLDVLLDPSGYFVGSYPCLRLFREEQTPQRIEVKRRTAEISLDRSARLIYTAYGKYIAVLRGYLGDEAFLETVTNKSGEWPDRLKVPDYELCDTPLHRRERPVSFNDFDVSLDNLDPSC
ncbi:hypothetical protein FEP57_05122 [Burkholderia multivorans]|nr:hypothetical protein [Burkholderia multivorans]